MLRRLIRYAIISSPVLAFYGIIPLYILEGMSLGDFFLKLGGLSAQILVVWAIHIFIALRRPGTSDLKKFMISYLAIVVFQALAIVVINPPPFPHREYLAYPVLTAAAFNIIVLLLCNSVIAESEKTSARLEVQELRFQNSEAQKKLLLQQLQPHFLFNTLTVLKSMIRERPDEAELYSMKLSGFLRYSIDASNQLLVPLAQEYKFAMDFVELQQARFGKAFMLHVDMSGVSMQKMLPVYSLQTLLENAFKHNYFTMERPLQISLRASHDTIQVWNNKVSLRLTERSGTGLANLNERYKLISGKEILIVDSRNSFSVTIKLLDHEHSNN